MNSDKYNTEELNQKIIKKVFAQANTRNNNAEYVESISSTAEALADITSLNQKEVNDVILDILSSDNTRTPYVENIGRVLFFRKWFKILALFLTPTSFFLPYLLSLAFSLDLQKEIFGEGELLILAKNTFWTYHLPLVIAWSGYWGYYIYQIAKIEAIQRTFLKEFMELKRASDITIIQMLTLILAPTLCFILAFSFTLIILIIVPLIIAGVVLVGVMASSRND